MREFPDVLYGLGSLCSLRGYFAEFKAEQRFCRCAAQAPSQTSRTDVHDPRQTRRDRAQQLQP